MSHFTYLSLGAGVQSSALLVMSASGLYGCPRADIAVFADTGDEPQWVYDQMNVLTRWGEEHGIPVHTVRQGHLSHDYLHGNGDHSFASPPLFLVGPNGEPGMLRRQCTEKYKIRPIHRFIRTHLGYEPRQRVKHHVTALNGISIDESHRMKASTVGWITLEYPLVDAEMTRRDCEKVMVEHGFPIPLRSACVFCPFHSDAYWQRLKDYHPEEFAKAVTIDRAIRHSEERRGIAYLHQSRQPLDEVDFNPTRDQVDMFGNECEGMCGV